MGCVWLALLASSQTKAESIPECLFVQVEAVFGHRDGSEPCRGTFLAGLFHCPLPSPREFGLQDLGPFGGLSSIPCAKCTLFASAVAAKAVNQSVDSICRDTTYTLIISPNLRNGTLILSLQAFITTYRSSSSVFMTNKTPRVAKTRRESTTPHHVATRHSQNGQIIVFLFFFLLRSTLPHDGFRTKQQHFQPSSAMTHHFFSLPPSQKSSPGCPLNNYFVTPFSRLYACALNDHLATIRSKLLLKIAELEVPCAVVKVFIGLFQIHLMSVPPPPPPPPLSQMTSL